MTQPILDLLVGGFSSPGGTSQGISLVRHDRRQDRLDVIGRVASTPSPSFLALSVDRRTVYCVNEIDEGRVSAFRRKAEPAPYLELIGTSPTRGAQPTHLAVHPSGRFLFVANYESGSVSVIEVGTDGVLGAVRDLVPLTGSGPDPDRQTHTYAHCVVPSADGLLLAVTDLGSDRVWRFGVDAQRGRLTPLAPVVLPAGSGPRDLVLDEVAGRAYVLGELDGTITVLAWSAEPEVVAVLPNSRSRPTPDHAAGLALSPDRTRLVAGHRSSAEVDVWRVTPTGLHLAERRPAAGTWPRQLSLHGPHVYVANQRSNSIAAIRLDDDGRSVAPDLVAAVPSPTMVLAV